MELSIAVVQAGEVPYWCNGILDSCHRQEFTKGRNTNSIGVEFGQVFILLEPCHRESVAGMSLLVARDPTGDVVGIPAAF